MAACNAVADPMIQVWACGWCVLSAAVMSETPAVYTRARENSVEQLIMQVSITAGPLIA